MSSVGTTFLGRRMRSFRSSPEFDGFSKVIITVSDEIEYSAGTDSGRTLRLTNPWGTPEMAQDILNSIRGFQYQPYAAEGALLDPAAELGDGVTANDVYSGIYTKRVKFGPLMTATVSAPEDEEINHEYPYRSKPNKVITREAKMLRASLAIESARIAAEVAERKSDVQNLSGILEVQSKKIEAKVSQTGGDASSFGWELLNNSWTVKGNGRDVFKVTQDGADVYGKITATSGRIGGFDILANYLSYNNQVWDGTNTQGVYLGVSGIQLGKNFKVDIFGNLTANSGKFTGTVYAGNIQYGESEGYLSGSGISSGSIYGNRLVAGTITTTYTSAGINSGVAGGVLAKDVFSGYDVATYIKTKTLIVGSTQYTKQTVTFRDYYGNTRSITALMPAVE